MKLFARDKDKETTAKAKRILIVDDENSIADLFGTYLSKNGYEVTVARSGEEALATLNSSGEFDVMTLDVELGDVNGMDILIQINTKHPKLPVIIVTGLGYEEELVQRAIQGRAAGFVSKTLPLSQLLMEVRRALVVSPS